MDDISMIFIYNDYMDLELLSLAEKLKESITSSEEYLTLIQREKEMESDREVMALAYRKDMANTDYNDMVRFFGKDSKEAKEALERFFLAKKNLESHEKVRLYLESYQKVRLLLEEVNKILFEDFNSELCLQKE